MSQVLEVDDRNWLLFLSVTNNSLAGEYFLIIYVLCCETGKIRGQCIAGKKYMFYSPEKIVGAINKS